MDQRKSNDRPTRIDVRYTAVLITSDGLASNVVVKDISAAGFRLDASDDLIVGEHIQPRVGKEGPVMAELRWTQGPRPAACSSIPCLDSRVRTADKRLSPAPKPNGVVPLGQDDRRTAARLAPIFCLKSVRADPRSAPAGNCGGPTIAGIHLAPRRGWGLPTAPRDRPQLRATRLVAPASAKFRRREELKPGALALSLLWIHSRLRIALPVPRHPGPVVETREGNAAGGADTFPALRIKIHTRAAGRAAVAEHAAV